MSRVLSSFSRGGVLGINSKHNNGFITSLIRLEAYSLLSYSDYEKIINQPTYADSVKILEDQYDYNISDSLQESFNTVIYSYIDLVNKAFSGIGNPYNYFRDFIFVPRDLFNLKVLSKGSIKGLSFHDLSITDIGYIPEEELTSFYEDMSEPIKVKKIQYYLDLYLKNPPKEKDSYSISVFWDKQIHHFYYTLFSSLKSEILLSLYKLQVDIINITTILRLKIANKIDSDIMESIIFNGNLNDSLYMSLLSLDINNIINDFKAFPYSDAIKQGLEEYKSSNSLFFLEKYLNEYFLEMCYASISHYDNEDIAIIFYWLKMVEIANLKIILSGKKSLMEKSWITEKIKRIL